ncbi:YlaH-like family protein [Salirhabdus sp. Marseille-P4669]|uniref:YlaH-like family protein n=1 Tax=Salirhabdus sp. Marseille-P4669 TaxID=2042310 RepID=UPI001F2D39FA|nr:YlaH-like family protein [Salirhabdus sp. Marseille-P4669]
MDNNLPDTIPSSGFRPISEYFLIEMGDKTGYFLLYLVIVILTIITYKLGFAKKLPLLKSLVVYILLVIGCFILWFFGFKYPIAEVLVISILVLGIYRFRLHRERKNREDTSKGVE